MNFPPNTLYIHDNLPVLRGMDGETVDLIYLDPPFNSKREYRAPIGTAAEGQSFDDTWRWDALDEHWLGEIDRRNEALSAVIHAARLTQGNGTGAYLAFMGIRLLELHRVLKPTGSIYLHCDDTANSYLRAEMDAVFGKGAHRNEIVWQRYGSHNDAKKFGRVSDRILYYAGKNAVWNQQRIPLDEETIAKNYSKSDERGRYTTSPLHARTLTGGGYRYKWRGIEDLWKFPKARLDELDADGRIHWPARGRVPRRKVYLSEVGGKPMPDVLTDIPIVSGKERTGWATQKPLALLQRIVKASSNEGDLVLDPFAGCATCCVAAAMEGRRWVGIDACEAASDIVRVRLSDAKGGALAGDFYRAKIRKHPPRRTDSNGDEPQPKSKAYRTQENIDYLYGKQRGYCNGCDEHYRVKDLAVDHIVPQSKGGSHTLDNLQLLCAHCNSTKHDGTMAELRKRLKEQAASRTRFGV